MADNEWTRRITPLRTSCRAAVALLLSGCVLALISACSAADSGGSSRGAPSSAPSTSAQTGGRNTSDNDEKWSVALLFFSGPDHLRQARASLPLVTRETGRSDLFLRTRDSGTAIMAGRYDGPGDESALSDMDRLRAITRGSQRPYAQAYLAPPIFEADEGSIPAYDLANAKQRYGADRAVFTLEYALFDEGSRRDYQREAEREAQRLRDAGEQAFYYHGRRGSLVTLGLFPEGAVDAVTRRYAYEVDVLQRRYKFAMHNGARVERENGGFFPTKLVRVP